MRDSGQAKATIKYILNMMDANTRCADSLIFEIMNTESQKFMYNKQCGVRDSIGAFGYIQMEIATYNDIVDNFLKYKPDLMKVYERLINKNFDRKWDLRTNMALQIFMCRCHFMRIKEPIPQSKIERARYWKQYYNTKLGKGTVEHYIKLNK